MSSRGIDHGAEDHTEPRRRGSRTPSRGFRTLLVVVYGIFAVSASARSLVQISRDFSEAPLAYSLSLFAALTYLALTFLLARKNPRYGIVGVIIALELVGVIAVGMTSILLPEYFHKATVWSHFGAGYGYVPLALPLIAGTTVAIQAFRRS